MKNILKLIYLFMTFIVFIGNELYFICSSTISQGKYIYLGLMLSAFIIGTTILFNKDK